MKFKKFMDLYDNWNGVIRVNDNNLDMIVEGKTAYIAEKAELHNMEVVAFGFYDNILTVRVNSKAN